MAFNGTVISVYNKYNNRFLCTTHFSSLFSLPLQYYHTLGRDKPDMPLSDWGAPLPVDNSLPVGQPPCCDICLAVSLICEHSCSLPASVVMCTQFGEELTVAGKISGAKWICIRLPSNCGWKGAACQCDHRKFSTFWVSVLWDSTLGQGFVFFHAMASKKLPICFWNVFTSSSVSCLPIFSLFLPIGSLQPYLDTDESTCVLWGISQSGSLSLIIEARIYQSIFR